MARDSRPLSRRPGTRREAETIGIACEGQKTEDISFNGIRREYRLATARIEVVGVGADPLRVVEAAATLKNNHDHVWAVFDVEAPAPPGPSPRPPSGSARSG